MLKKLLLSLKVSRPGLWFQTLWLYLLPTAQNPSYFGSYNFWLGLIYVLFPLNFLVYGLNDLADWKIDQYNPRKNSYLFGAKIQPPDFKFLIWAIALTQILFGILLLLRQERLWHVLVAIFGVNILYNLPKWGLRAHPPFELFNQLGYLLVLPFSILLNQTAFLPWPTILYLVLFCTHAHLMGEIMDVVPDKRTGRKTSAVFLGVKTTKCIIIILVAIESFWLWHFFKETVLSLFLLLGVVWLLLDVLVLYQDRNYTRKEFNLLGYGLNLSGYASIVWVWLSGKLN
ncbi:MAG: UbiA family prenyltransferase [Verrucomicrobiia bacterium]